MKDPQPPEETTRPPCLEDILFICKQLNAAQADYIIIGGLAIFELGLARMTEDIDLLVDSDPDNVMRIKKALACLPDNAVRDVEPTDVREYMVVRVNDEVTIDLMASACGIGYKQASTMIQWREIQGVRIPFATPELLWLTKQTHREKDALDRAYLRKLFADRGIEPPSM